jgi:hypothetical protein
MIRRLRARRLSRLQLMLVAGASGLATALIIVGATGRTSLQSAVLAALQQRRVVVHSTPVPAATIHASVPESTAPPSPAAGASSSSPATSSSSSGSSSGSSSSATGNSGAASTSTTDTTGTSSTSTGSTTTATAGRTYKVKHVFVIALSAASYRAAFGHGSIARYLNHTLVRRGTLLTNYRTLGRAELPDYLAMVSGQGPNPDTRRGCARYAEFPGSVKPNAAGLVGGAGCVYPNTVLTIGDQVTAAGHVWKAYLDDMGRATCLHPNSGAADGTPLAGAGGQYDTRHNPFIYFHSLLDLGDCSTDDESLDQLPGDLRSRSRTPSYAYIAPGLCDDASAPTCPDRKPAGLAGEDAFLKLWVPRILGSAAYKRDGALIIAFATTPTGAGSHARGPMCIGALVLSRYAARGRKLSGKYGPYSLLRSIEDVFGFKALGHAESAQSFASAALPRA